ncbi:YjbF family lipoprotein [Halomonas sp.]|uniref:YjbF family lipoprotein n=1 Tax=Halomonas sp. TaxID=1486246 RepID=UPI0039A2683C
MIAQHPTAGRFQGRLRAALSCALLGLLAGCASQGQTPLAASLQALWPDDEVTVANASAIPHASLSVSIGDVQGLMVLGTQAGDMTYWPAQHGMVLELHDGGLHATNGLAEDLLGTHYDDGVPWRQDAPASFTLVRHWHNRQGEVVRSEARGMMRCRGTERLPLPLEARDAERCNVSLDWIKGDTTTATYWRDPDTRRLWAVQETPWPGAPTMQWQVARHWW